MKRWIGVLVFCICQLTMLAQIPTPVMDSIVVVNGQSHIYWTPNTSNTDGYRISHLEGPYGTAITDLGIITGINSREYVDTKASNNPCSNNQNYCIVAYKLSGTDTSWSNGANLTDARGTIFLDKISFENCFRTIHLNWRYAYRFPGFNHYEVYLTNRSAKTDSLFTITTDTTYDYTSLPGGFEFKRDSIYCFRIVAISGSDADKKVSTSCSQCFTAHYPPKPDVLDAYSVSVYQNKGVSISCLIDSLKINGYVGISREAEDENGYTFMGYIPVKGDTSVVSGWDSTAWVNDKWYRYAMVALDSCFIPYLYDMANSIHLGGKVEDSRTNFLHWNAYQSLSDSVIAYLILRKISGYADSVIQLPADSLLYYDRISLYENLGLEFDYLVQAVVLPRSMLNDGIADSLQYRYCNSNSIVIFQNLKLFLPNAFRPGGINPKFSPGDFIKAEISNFRLTIFNRWGQQLYTTTEQSEGWDGRMNGEDMPTGVYVYVLSFTTQRGNTVQQKGTVTLVR